MGPHPHPLGEDAAVDKAARTWLDVVDDIANEFGLTLTTDEADYILWEHTGFPSFFNGDPVTECEAQLRLHFASTTGRAM